jgi:hypothetical protein
VPTTISGGTAEGKRQFPNGNGMNGGLLRASIGSSGVARLRRSGGPPHLLQARWSLTHVNYSFASDESLSSRYMVRMPAPNSAPQGEVH